MPKASLTYLQPSPDVSVDNHLSLLIRRAETELGAGHFEDVKAALEPYAGRGHYNVDLLLAFALTGLGQAQQAAPLLVSVGLASQSGQHPAVKLIDLFGSRNQREAARDTIEAAHRLTPNDPRILDALGDILCHLGRYDEAIEALDRSLVIRPVSPLTLNFKAIALMEKGDVEPAAEIFRKVLELMPDNASALSNLACLYSATNRPEDALALYRSAVMERPANAVIRLNYSISLLKAERYAQGWAEHEWRLKLPGHSQLPQQRLLPSLGAGVDISGKRILVTQEEGLGDTLMYLRYLPALARRGAIVHVWVPETLGDLCRRVEGIAITQVGGTLPEYDWHCPFISLPRVFVGTEEEFGAPVPYLHADPLKVAEAKKLLPCNGKLNVGVVWGGAPRPHLTSAMMLDRRRSMHLAQLDPLGKIPGINLISFQKGPYAEEGTILPCGTQLYDMMPYCDTLDDTAAFLMGVDVLVSVDTSVVHLAGGLGRPVLLMDRFDNCWRWISGRKTSVWYPDLTIFRQQRPRDWTGVVKQVGRALRAMSAEKRRS